MKLGEWDALGAFNISEQTVAVGKKERYLLYLPNERKGPMLECSWNEFA